MVLLSARAIDRRVVIVTISIHVLHVVMLKRDIYLPIKRCGVINCYPSVYNTVESVLHFISSATLAVQRPVANRPYQQQKKHVPVLDMNNIKIDKRETEG